MKRTTLLLFLLTATLSWGQSSTELKVRRTTARAQVVVFGDVAGQLDEFGRLKAATPKTLFDSKLLVDKDSLFWDEKVVNGSGLSSAVYQRPTVLFTAGTGDSLIRQTRAWINYQPGKSQETMMTATATEQAGAVCRIGQFHGTEGLLWKISSGIASACVRTGGVETCSSALNVDPLDGTGPSGVDLDFSKSQIYFIGYEWLGVGRVRFGVIVDGVLVVSHILQHANFITTPYIASPNLPLRYQLNYTGAGTATMRVICSTVISGGGSEALGGVHSASTNGTHLDANAVDTAYVVMAFKLNPSKLASTVRFEGAEFMAETNTTNGEWFFAVNPTVQGVLTFVPEPNSAVMVARGATTNIVNGKGLGQIGGGQMSQSTRTTGGQIPDAWSLGCKIDTTQQDTLVLGFRPGTGNADIQATAIWRELR